MFSFWSTSKPPLAQYDAIKNEDYGTVVEIVNNPESIIDFTSLMAALCVNNSGILRLLLTHPSADPNPLLIEALNRDLISHVIAILESPRLVFDINQVDPSIATICRKGLTDIMLIIFEHYNHALLPSFNYVYLNEAIKSQATDLIKIMLNKSMLFDVRSSNYQCVVTACSFKTDVGLNILALMLGKSDLSPEKLCGDPLSETFIRDNVKGFRMILDRCKEKGIMLSTDLVSKCLDKGKDLFFDVILDGYMSEGAIKKLIKICIERDKVNKLQLILENTKVQLESHHLTYAAVNEAAKCFSYMLEVKVVPCNYTCAIRDVLNKYKDKYAYNMLISGWKCKHTNANAKLALKNYCWDTLKELVQSDEIVMSADMAGELIVHAPEEIVRLAVCRIDEVCDEDIYKVLNMEKYNIIHILLDAKIINIDWNNYALLKPHCIHTDV